jgi:hypothetical protein
MQWASIKVISNFSDMLTKVNDKHHLTPDTIHNVGEMNVKVNPKGQSKILALKACNPVGVLSFSQKGENLTGVMCFSASGSFAHPYIPQEKKAASFSNESIP